MAEGTPVIPPLAGNGCVAGKDATSINYMRQRNEARRQRLFHARYLTINTVFCHETVRRDRLILPYTSPDNFKIKRAFTYR